MLDISSAVCENTRLRKRGLFKRMLKRYEETTVSRRRISSSLNNLSSPRVAGRYAVVGARSATLEGIAPIHHPLAGNAEVSQSVVFLFYSGVGHTRHPRSLLWKAQVIRSARRATAGGLHRLRAAVMRTSVSATTPARTS